MPELLEEEDWPVRRAVVDAAYKQGSHLSYYDHLPVDEWMPPFATEQGKKQYVKDFQGIAEKYLGIYRQWLCSVYPTNTWSIQLCAALLFWNVVRMLEAAYFLTRWLLPFDRLDWNNIKQMLANTRLLQAFDQHCLADDPEMIIMANMEIPLLIFDHDFPIEMERGEGSTAEVAYNPQLHGDLHLHVQAFREPPEEKEQGEIKPMAKEQYL